MNIRSLSRGGAPAACLLSRSSGSSVDQIASVMSRRNALISPRKVSLMENDYQHFMNSSTRPSLGAPVSHPGADAQPREHARSRRRDRSDGAGRGRILARYGDAPQASAPSAERTQVPLDEAETIARKLCKRFEKSTLSRPKPLFKLLRRRSPRVWIKRPHLGAIILLMIC